MDPNQPLLAAAARPFDTESQAITLSSLPTRITVFLNISFCETLTRPQGCHSQATPYQNKHCSSGRKSTHAAPATTDPQQSHGCPLSEGQRSLHTLSWLRRNRLSSSAPPLLPLQRAVATVCLERKPLLFFLLPTTPQCVPWQQPVTLQAREGESTEERFHQLNASILATYALAACRPARATGRTVSNLEFSVKEGPTPSQCLPLICLVKGIRWLEPKSEGQLQCHKMCHLTIRTRELKIQMTLKDATVTTWMGILHCFFNFSFPTLSRELRRELGYYRWDPFPRGDRSK